ncbi:MAG: guanylate kinase [Candidatus Aminicenantes bacterium]|nr:guanylate kinase [Candidatus Aminicenantes bacterium]
MLIVITGPSGAGKTTLIRRLLEKHPELKFSVSHTTRPPRPGEIDGVDYHFVSEAEFTRLLKKGFFVEWAVVHGFHYGTSKNEFKKSRFSDLILDIDVQGAKQIRNMNQKVKEALFIFILPPSRACLEKRLMARGDLSMAEFELRLRKASQEIKSYRLFDYFVINDDLDRALDQIEAIILAEHLRLSKMKKQIKEILNSFRMK